MVVAAAALAAGCATHSSISKAAYIPPPAPVQLEVNPRASEPLYVEVDTDSAFRYTPENARNIYCRTPEAASEIKLSGWRAGDAYDAERTVRDPFDFVRSNVVGDTMHETFRGFVASGDCRLDR